MAIIQKVSGHLNCPACQKWLLRPFLPEHRQLPQRSWPPRLVSNHDHQSRGFRASNCHLADDTQGHKGNDVPRRAALPSQTPVSRGQHETQSPADTSDTTTEKPWYLQVQNDHFRHLNPIIARQQLPPLPLDPPPFLEGFLNHLSVDIGLDHLSLLDLRKIDPPPALGANLIMIFGTVRSEKHLNVAADRFCRWLRTEHKLTPYADGLLGRNELKLKMRRKLRRTKMLSAAGAREVGDQDDGVTTGWICVNAGAVNQSSVTNEELDDGVVGFGRRSDGTHVVVQMMTEEKRGELDLETLWQGILKRSLKKQEQLEDMASSTPPSITTEKAAETSSQLNTPSMLSNMPQVETRQQVRSFHTANICLHADRPSTTLAEPDPAELEPQLLSREASWSQEPDHVVSPRNELVLEEIGGDNVSSTSIGSSVALRTHLNYLTNLSDDAAVQALGDGEKDKSSTTFLRSFHEQLPPLRETSHWQVILGLHSYGLHLAHPGYTQVGHINLLRSMMASTPLVPVETFENALDTILFSAHRPSGGNDAAPRHERWRLDASGDTIRFPPRNPTESKGYHALRSSLGLACEILEFMEAQGHDITTPRILLSLHHAISSPRFAEDLFQGESPDLTSVQVERLQYFYTQALNLIYDESQHIPRAITTAMLKTYTQHSNWRGFWSVWRSLPASAQRRDEEQYTILYNALADSSDVRETRRALSEYVEVMGLERPAVEVEKDGELALALARALVVAGFGRDSEKGRWRLVWERCARGLDLVTPERVMDVLGVAKEEMIRHR